MHSTLVSRRITHTTQMVERLLSRHPACIRVSEGVRIALRVASIACARIRLLAVSLFANIRTLISASLRILHRLLVYCPFVTHPRHCTPSTGVSDE